MRKTRVLVVSGFSAFFKQGGGEVEAASLRTALHREGFDADLYGPDIIEIDTYDLVIFFSCHSSGIELLDTCKEIGIRFILWPNFWANDEKKIEPQEIENTNKLCSGSDVIAFKTKAEMLIFQKYFEFDSNKGLILNWFVDEEIYTGANGDRFKDLYRIDNYILNVGLIEPVKNQLLLIEAALEAKTRLVLIGGFRRRDYFEACLGAAKDSVIIIPHLPPNSEVLRAAYAGCSAYVELSYDPPGRSAIEAAMFKKPLILTKSEWVKEIFEEKVTSIEPDNKTELIQSIEDVNNLRAISSAELKLLRNKHSPQQALKSLFKYVHEVRVGW